MTPGRDRVMVSTSSGETLPALAALAAASASAWLGCPPGTSLMAMSVMMSHSPQVARHARAVRAAIDFKEAMACFEDALFRHIPSAPRARRAPPAALPARRDTHGPRSCSPQP